MRTNIELDDQLLAAAQHATGLTTKRATVEEGLRLLVRIGHQQQLRALRGHVEWDGDLDEMRSAS